MNRCCDVIKNLTSLIFNLSTKVGLGDKLVTFTPYLWLHGNAPILLKKQLKERKKFNLKKHRFLTSKENKDK